MNRFTHDQHGQLATYLSTPKNFPWIMSYDNVEAIRNFYAQFPMFCFALQYSANKHQKGQEILIHPDLVRIPKEAKQALPAVA